MDPIGDRGRRRDRRLAAFDRISGPTWTAVYRQFAGRDLERWTEQFDRLCSVSGPSLASGYVHASLVCARHVSAAAAFDLGERAIALCTSDGTDLARLLLVQSTKAVPKLPQRIAFDIWLGALDAVIAEDPQLLRPVLDRIESLLAAVDVAGFAAWVSAGLASSRDRQRYFAMSVPHARRVLDQEAGSGGLDAAMRAIKSFTVALWQIDPTIRPVSAPLDMHSVRRPVFDGSMFRLPDGIGGYTKDEERLLYFAAVAHMGAHLTFSGTRFSVGSLKPMQIALVSLIEDARVETLAGRRYPGLIRLWRRFHEARPEGPNIADGLMSRLARALIDPEFDDPSPWVRKGVSLFQQRLPDIEDPRMSREIGNLLGNDLGQMRVQFNAKTYAVQPPYRDDGTGLWDFGDPPPNAEEQEQEVLLAARVTQQEAADGRQDRDASPEDDRAETSPVRPAEPDPDVGIPVARYPEWDRRAERLRPDWVTVQEYGFRPASAGVIESLLSRYHDTRARIAALVDRVRVSRPVRLRRQPDGDRLDLDACIRAVIDRRAGAEPDRRVYEVTARLHRDMSVLLLLDISESTKDTVAGTAESVFAIERAATALLADAMSGVGDPFALRAFCSDGRDDVRFYRVKDFEEGFNDSCRARLAALRPGLSTRLGAALRHASAEIARKPSHRRLVLLVTDGEPSDVDAPDPLYLVEDARKAVQEMARLGVDVFCVGLTGAGVSQLTRIFGSRNMLQIDKVTALPDALPKLYFRLIS
ncbi:MAG: VWA domain-containing protein [Alphaproteobacteria bacterium]|nr:VWA domain-containing protein [Alphaproteobacteria bacterium]